MKIIIILVIFAALLLAGCGKLDDAKKAMNAVKQAAEVVESTADSFKDMDEDEIKKIKLNEKEVRSFFNNVSEIKEKYPDIHFQVAQVALIEAMSTGENLQNIVKKEMNISFDDYTRLSTVITFAEAVGAGLQLTKSMHEQMVLGKEALETQLSGDLTTEQKDELEKALTEAKQEIEEFEKEMNSDEYANIKHNYDLVLKIKEELDI
jgi:PBP1b-binding outer membrane lipoprotein LpoB